MIIIIKLLCFDHNNVMHIYKKIYIFVGIEKEEKKLTKISAITRGWRMGLRMKTNKRVAITTKITCNIKTGSA